MSRLCVLGLCIFVLVVACSGGPSTLAPAPTPTPTLFPSVTPLPSSTPTPTLAPLPSPTLPRPTRGPTLASSPAGSGASDVLVDCATRLAESPIPYGVNGWWTDQHAGLWRAHYAELRPQIVRLPLAQVALEPVNDDDDPGHINWAGFDFERATPLPVGNMTLTYRQWFEMLRDIDATVMLYVPYLSAWLSASKDGGLYATYPPRSIQEYREFVEAVLRFLVAEVNYPPERIMVEAMNEPDLECGQDPAVPCFWQDWTMDDLVQVVRAVHEAANAVDPAIRVVGLAECCGTQLTEALLDDYDGEALLDGLTYHHYVDDADLGDGLDRGQLLLAYGKPVYIDEYGSSKYWSDGQEGALWHSYALSALWQEGISPIQFSMAEFPGMHTGYNQLGLLRGWEHNWEAKPAYAVYAGFFRHMGPAVPVATTAQTPLLAAAGLVPAPAGGGPGGAGGLVVWVVNIDANDRPGVAFQVRDFPARGAQVTVYDILAGDEPVDTLTIEGVPLAFTYSLPARSVYLFSLEITMDDQR